MGSAVRPETVIIAMSAVDKSLRKIIYLSGTRADFGLMRSTLQLLSRNADLSVAVTGMHLASGFGSTIKDIRSTGLSICGEVPTDVTTRTPASMSAGVGACLMGLTTLLVRERPDLLLLLGDRGEMLAGAISALHLGIVCAHIHGGERSGTVDEPVRHAISKLSHYHLVATHESSERLIRMGERADSVHITGAPGLDGLVASAGMSAESLKGILQLPLDTAFILAVFHPVVQQAADAYAQTACLLLALQKTGLPVVWMEPNSDAGSTDILSALTDIALPTNSSRHKHMDRTLFSTAMKHCAVMVGNSSAGIIEAASFATPVVNVGDRQRLRERSANVTDVTNEMGAVHLAITHALSADKVPCDNKHGDGRTGPRIVSLLTTLSLDRLVLDKSNSY